MTVKEFAARAEISLSLAYALIEEGRVPCRRIGRKGRRGKIVIREDDLIKFLESVRVKSEESRA
jgi:excisionase family DNA binding protein